MRFITNAFFAALCIIGIFKPVTNQQIRTKTNAFPANEHDHIIGAHHQQQHGEYKEIQVRKITGKMFALSSCM